MTSTAEFEARDTRVAAVVVLYRPTEVVIANVAALQRQCRRVLVVPNSPTGPVETTLRESGCVVLNYESNGGTAVGFNRGIRQILDTGPEEYVILSDQDSRAPDGVVSTLIRASRAGADAGLRVAAVAPRLADIKNAGRPIDVRPDTATLLEVPTLASSGTLVHRDVYEAIGLLDETLVIDGVDHEWCLRAASRGFRSYVVPEARLLHNMGDRLVRFGGRPRLLHFNPVRHYYIIRNSLLLLRRPYLPRLWRAAELARTLRRLVGYAVLSDNRARSVRYMARALADAALNRGGPLRAD